MTTTTDTAFEPGTIAHVDPTTLLLERNIREVKVSPDLVASIKDIGVQQPIVAVVADDGRLLVRLGHRRTAAAVEAGVTSVPVYVADVDAIDTAAEVGRIIRQHDENTVRDGLTAAEEVGVVEQLAAFGLSADDIAAQARLAKDRVTTALAVSGSKMARKATDRYADLSLDQAAAVAEFDDDTETAKKLIVVATKEPRQFDHVLQRARDDRERDKARAAAIEELTAAGAKIFEHSSYDSRSRWKSLDYLVEVNTGKNVTPASHKKCPGHGGYVNHAGRVEYGCADPGKYGHRDRYSSGPAKAKASDMSDKERAKAAAERRLVVENNKAWTSAQTVRREWLNTFAKYKTAPKGAAAFIAAAISLDSHHFGEYNRQPDELTAALLGLTYTSGHVDLAAATAKATDARALQIAVIHACAIYEIHAMQRHHWRQDGTSNATGRYLRFLASVGYTLSEVEEYAISKKTA